MKRTPFPGWGSPLRYAHVIALRCPACRGTRFERANGTRRFANGGKSERRRCRDCGHGFIAVYE